MLLWINWKDRNDRLSLKNALKAKKDLIDSVDKVIYLLSKAQYSLSEQQTLKYDPCFALIKTMFWSWHFEYVDNLDTIKENVKKLKLYLNRKLFLIQNGIKLVVKEGV